MTDFETHPAGTADLVKRLRSYQEFEQNRDGQIICVESEIANEAADHIEQLVATVEQLEANTKELGYFLAEYMAKAFTSDRTATELREALTRANAATAAAYEVAASTIEVIVSDAQKEVGSIKLSKVDAAVVEMLNGIAAAIRALATPDQTAALDKLIAEAVGPYLEALIWCSGSADFNDGGFAREGWLKLCKPLLAASKKGGV